MDKASVTRYTVLVITLINAFLNIIGYQTIPTDWGTIISGLIVGAAGLWAGWKNNYLSQKGKAQRDVLEKNGLL